MKPYVPKSNSHASQLMRKMACGQAYTAAELSQATGIPAHIVPKALAAARVAGFVEAPNRGSNRFQPGTYTLLTMPNFRPTEVAYHRVIKWRGGKAKLAALWPIGPCVDLSNKYNMEAFYAVP